jgi:hypothetical protein
MKVNILNTSTTKLVTLADIAFISTAIRRKLENTMEEDPDGCEYVFKIVRDVVKRFGDLVEQSLDLKLDHKVSWKKRLH